VPEIGLPPVKVTPLEQFHLGIAVLVKQGMPAIAPDRHVILLSYLDLLSKWNRVYNLTSVRDPATMLDRHLLDSLMMNRWLPTSPAATTHGVDVMDIGSGAGLPVLPLAIIRPDLQFISVESNGKKTRFQQQVLLELGIANVRLVNQRVESVTDTAQFVTSRAFTSPQQFLSIAYPLCAESGRVAVMLGVAERMPTAIGPQYVLEELVGVEMPGTESARHIAVCRRQPEEWITLPG